MLVPMYLCLYEKLLLKTSDRIDTVVEEMFGKFLYTTKAFYARARDTLLLCRMCERQKPNQKK